MAAASKNIFWLTASRIFASVLLFWTYRQLFRYLGPHGTGQHQFVLSYVAIFGVILDFGLQQYIVKKMTEEPDRIKTYFHHYLVFGSVLAVLVYAAVLIVAAMNHYEPVVFQAIAIAGSGLIITALTYPFLAVMSAFQDLGKVALINFFNSMVNVIIILLTIALKKYIVFLVLVQPLAALLSLIMYLFYIRKYLKQPEYFRAFRSIDRATLKIMVRSVLPFAMLVGFSTIYNRLDVILITNILGYAQNGLYSAAYKFFDFVAFFPAVVSHSLYPMFATFMARGAIADVRSSLEKYLRFMIAIALPMGVGGMLLARPLILILTNDIRYLDAAPVLAILVWAPAVLFVYIVANSIVISQLTKLAVAITGFNVIVNVVGNLLLLPHVGIRGAAIMTVASEAVQGAFYLYFIHRRITPFTFFPLWWKPIAASAIMGIAVWFVRPYGLIPSIAAGSIVYGICLLALKFFGRDDIDFVRKLFRRAEPVQP